MSVVVFSTTVAQDGAILIDDYTDKKSLLTAIGNLPYLKGHTFTDLALNYLTSTSLTKANAELRGVNRYTSHNSQLRD